MPYKNTLTDLTSIVTLSDKVALAPDGARITGVSVLAPFPASAFSLYLLLGNNQQPIGPISGPCVIEIPDDAPDSDTREGLFLVNDSAQAGVRVPVIVSYERGDAVRSNAGLLVRSGT